MAVDLPGKTLTSITGGVSGRTFCALDSSGSAYCWGFGNSDVPVPAGADGALAGKRIAQISTSGFHTCALDSTGAAYCWGDNYYGELGDGTTASSALPVAVDATGVLAGKVLTQVSAGGNFWTCATDTTGAVYCWGNNSQGALGDGSSAASSDVPVQAGPSPPASVTAVPGNRSAVVSWAAPAIPGGSAGYTAFASPGWELCITATTRCTITGLTNQVTYRVTVIAHTATTNSRHQRPRRRLPPAAASSSSSIPYDTAAFGNAFKLHGLQRQRVTGTHDHHEGTSSCPRA